MCIISIDCQSYMLESLGLVTVLLGPINSSSDKTTNVKKTPSELILHITID